MNQEGGSRPTRLVPWSQTSSLQKNCEKFCCVHASRVCGILLEQPEQTKKALFKILDID